MQKVCLGMLVLSLSACVTQAPAPSETRQWNTAQNARSIVKNSASEDGYYRVKAKDTLYRIALENGQDYRDLAKWNNIADPSSISEGMLLRVIPPGQTWDNIEKEEVKKTSAVLTKNAPKVGKVAYSQDNLKKESPIEVIDLSAKNTSKNVALDLKKENKTQSKIENKVPPNKTDRPTTKTEGGVVWGWPTNNPLRQGYSAATKGMEFSGKAGDAILAAADGKVVYAGNGLRGYGELVIIKHSALFLSAYGHNRKILVKEGQNVKRGQRIAEMGNSDSSTTQLHFELRRQGKPIDPAPYLPAR